MLHRLLNLTRSLFVFDTETTGVNKESSRIIEFAFQQWTATGLARSWRSYINPTIPIPRHTTEIHGIDDARMTRCNGCNQSRETCTCEQFRAIPRFRDIAERLAQGFSNCDYAGKKIRFDLEITAKEMERAGIVWDYADARIIDIDRLEAIAYPRDLSTLYEKYTGGPLEGAHGALSDVEGSTIVIGQQLVQHDVLPWDLDALHDMQCPGWLTACGRFRMMDGIAVCNFGKHKYTPVKDMPRDYLDWMIQKGQFPPDVKAFVARVKMGDI